MSKVTIKMNTRTAASVRQVLFDSQKGYTYDVASIPPRVSDIRGVIEQLDNNIDDVLNVE